MIIQLKDFKIALLLASQQIVIDFSKHICTLEHSFDKQLYNFIYVCLWYLMPLLTKFQLYCGGKFYWWKKPEHLEKTTDLLKVTDKQILYKTVDGNLMFNATFNNILVIL